MIIYYNDKNIQWFKRIRKQLDILYGVHNARRRDDPELAKIICDTELIITNYLNSIEKEYFKLEEK